MDRYSKTQISEILNRFMSGMKSMKFLILNGQCICTEEFGVWYDPLNDPKRDDDIFDNFFLVPYTVGDLS
jgi:hypothetical protein